MKKEIYALAKQLEETPENKEKLRTPSEELTLQLDKLSAKSKIQLLEKELKALDEETAESEELLRSFERENELDKGK